MTGSKMTPPYILSLSISRTLHQYYHRKYKASNNAVQISMQWSDHVIVESLMIFFQNWVSRLRQNGIW